MAADEPKERYAPARHLFDGVAAARWKRTVDARDHGRTDG